VFWGVSAAERATKVDLMNANGFPPPKLRKVDFSGIREDDFFYFRHEDPEEPQGPLEPGQTRNSPTLCSRDNCNFTLRDHHPRLKLVLSHAFAHSTRLDILEQQFRKISQVTKGIAPKQRATGRIPVDWEERDIISTMGALDAIRRELEIDGSIKNVHDLFWDEDELSDLLDDTREYLEIEERANHLSGQIEFLRSQLTSLQTEIHAQRSRGDHRGAIRREWYIILLIAYEAIVVKFFDIGTSLAYLMGV
jgi:uncharacterized Rmd1/YagE family protein